MTTVALKRLATLVTDCPPHGERPHVSLENVESGTGRLTQELSEYSEPEAGVAAVEPGDVLFGKLRPYLAKSWLADRRVYASTELLALRPNCNVDSRWLAYLLASRPLVEWAVATSDGAKMPRTSWEKLGTFRAEVPPRAVQGEIAAFLDAETARIDALIDKYLRAAALATERFEALTASALAPDAVPSVRLRHMSSGVTVGVVVNPSTYVEDDGPVLFFRGVDVGRFSLDLERAQRMSLTSSVELSKSTLRAGDIVSIRVGEPGVSAVVPLEADGANCASLLITRRSPRSDSRYLCYVFNSRYGRGQFRALANGAAQLQVNVSDAVDFRVPVRSLEDQCRIADELDSVRATLDALVAATDRQTARLRERRRVLITAAVTGELDLTRPGA